MNMNMFKKTIQDGVRFVPSYNNDPFHNSYVPVYKEVWDTKKIATIGGVFGVVIAMLCAVVLLAFTGGSDADATVSSDATYVVEEDVVVTTTTVPEPTVQYVCDMPASTSTEYALIEWSNGDPAYVDFPSVSAQTIVFTWNVQLSQEMRDILAKHIANVGIYVNKEMRIEDADYVAVDGEVIVPIVNGSTIKQLDGANYTAAIWTTSSMFFGTESSFAINDAKDSLEYSIREYGMNVVYHELGHLFGLEHTHVDNDGIDQVDSIMSYEHVWDAEGFEAGDIAGLQQIFCK